MAATTFEVFESKFNRVFSGIGDEWDRIMGKNQVSQDYLIGIFTWFKSNYPQKHQKLKECEDRIDELWLAGKTDEKSQAEFNEQLRIYRNGHVWLIEKFIADKKSAMGKPAQGKLI